MSRSLTRKLRIGAAKFLTVLVVSAVAAGLACERNSDSVPNGSKPSVSGAGQAKLDFSLFAPLSPLHQAGTLERGGRVEIAFTIRNAGNTPVELGPIETSCDCLEATLENRRVEPGHSVAGTFVIDFRKDPAYTGALLLTAEASTTEPTPRKAFTVRLSVDVK